ncbi:MAG: CoA-acylating methylmalonate-semialdehyde dehydrogenase, partial [Anaerolineae bacterium]|nr:CoA-acylating methylmalonate-semialdehyde dehydrogenase [Anaerolineae bacterium]
MAAETLMNFIGGEWKKSKAGESLDVVNPANLEVLGHVPMSPGNEVDLAAQTAHQAYLSWRKIPPGDRIQYLFKLKTLLEDNFDKIAEMITLENGKTLGESKGEMRRAIENVEVACGIPTMMQGGILEDIAPGIDEFMIRQPVGVCAIISPFNFPGMIPFWFLPYAVATGNTVILKPSERTPLTMGLVVDLMRSIDLPPGVVNMVHGGPDTVNAILDHPLVKAVSFVGSTGVARHIYARSALNGKRVQAQGGAKNPIIILPDADLDMSTKIIADSAFGCAGQRCLAASLAVTVGEARNTFTEAISDAADQRIVGFGLDQEVQMGPVITTQSKSRIEGLIGQAIQEGAEAIIDGRNQTVKGYEQGNFVFPTVLNNLNPKGEIAKTEIFGPVLGLVHVDTIEEAIAFVNGGQYGNMACLFTSSGASAR